MTRQTAQFRTRFAPMYAATIFAVLATGAALTQAGTGVALTQPGTQAPAMDVLAIMGGIDIGGLSVQGHLDAF